MEPAPSDSASHLQFSNSNIAAGLPRAQRQELQHLFEQALIWLEHDPPNYQQALTGLALCMKADPVAAVYTFQFLQTIDAAAEAGHLKFNWFQQRRNRKQVKEMERQFQQKNYNAVFEKAPKALYHNPGCVPLLQLLAATCHANDAQDSARTYCQFALQYDPTSTKTHQQILENYLAAGQFDDAKEHWLNLMTQRAMASVDLSRLRKTLPQSLQNHLPLKPLVILIQEAIIHQTESPQDEANWMQLRELYADNQLYSLAMECCQSASQALGNAHLWNHRILELRMQQADARLEFHAQNQPALIQELMEERLRVRTEFYQAQCTAHPTQSLYQIHLAWCLLETSNPDGALKLFEQIEHTDLPAAWSLITYLGHGEAQQSLRRFQPALALFQQAVAGISPQMMTTLTEQLKDFDIPILDGILLPKRILNRARTLARAMNSTEIVQNCELISKKTGISLEI
ncbi:MAG: hypothetical protein VX738_07510 [Planctomycetota bacterium]|nr:hypothetical protein [Planctomycetota bacterium]